MPERLICALVPRSRRLAARRAAYGDLFYLVPPVKPNPRIRTITPQIKSFNKSAIVPSSRIAPSGAISGAAPDKLRSEAGGNEQSGSSMTASPYRMRSRRSCAARAVRARTSEVLLDSEQTSSRVLAGGRTGYGTFRTAVDWFPRRECVKEEARRLGTAAGGSIAAFR